MDFLWDNKVVQKALFFATKAHEGQTMKQPTGTPYSAHVVGVLLNVVNFCCKDKLDWNFVCCCALLHDTLEDTQTTYEQLANLFGKKVADGVLALTKNEQLPYEKQMPDSIERIKKQPREIAVVKLADRLFNIRDRVPSWTKQKQDFYIEEAKLIYENLKYANENLANALEKAIGEY